MTNELDLKSCLQAFRYHAKSCNRSMKIRLTKDVRASGSLSGFSLLCSSGPVLDSHKDVGLWFQSPKSLNQIIFKNISFWRLKPHGYVVLENYFHS